MTQENENNFNEILEALADGLSCEPLKREDDGRVLFSIDDALGVALFTTNAEETGVDSIIVTFALGAAPTENASFLYKLLSANYLGAGTADGTLAIDENAQYITLTRVFELPVDVEFFVTAFARLANAARYWADLIAKELMVSSDKNGDENIIKC